MGRAWRGVSAKIGREGKQRQASKAFSALYDEQQTEREKRQDEDSKKDTTECTQREEGHKERNDGSTHGGGGQDRRDKPDNTDESRDGPLHDSVVTTLESQVWVVASLARGLLKQSHPCPSALSAWFSPTS